MLRKFLVGLINIRDHCQGIPLFLTRLGVGIFFAISGFNKLFVAESQKQILDTLVQAGIPLPHFNAVFVPLVEFVGGILLIIGLFTSLTAIVLFILLIVAIVTDGVGKIPAGLGPLDWLDYFLYLPEVLFEFLLLWLIFYGSGCIGIDKLIRRCLEKKE